MGQGLYASALSAASDPTHDFDLVCGPTSNLDGPLIKRIVQFIEPNVGPYLKWSVMKRCRSLCITTSLLPKNKPAGLPVVLFPFIDLVKLSVCSGTLAFDQHLKMIDDQELGFFANMLGIFVFVLLIGYHYVMAEAKYGGN
ncbi:Dolichyl-diphosphooligosaccharide--protein glycosyltransferase subunit 4A [Melia azedarach]|uniref:Dolichyl-diphosphooligosaccharide--protein glycosyltransferase subunit 4A n=1 Tax=Melia azedarach TaxID=155640 RepID=A0ACC1YA54_MELAZ|nr:Dolichyl-diphosphooligosaccharide--protein glycosyltransferase subunit 4A [Melia azedarach]